MSPKSDKTEWHECVTCKLIIHMKDVRKHSGCSLLPEEAKPNDDPTPENQGSDILISFLDTLDSLKHGFVYRGTLFAKNDETRRAEEVKSRPVHLQKRTVYIHPSAMKLCNMKIGDAVLVVGNNSEELLYAWPSYALHPVAISIYLLGGPEKKGHFAVRAYDRNIRVADRLCLSQPQENIDWKAFSMQLLIQNRDSFIKRGSILECNYFGQVIKVRILLVQSERCEIDMENVELGLQRLELGDSKPEPADDPFYMLKLSTKIVSKNSNSSISEHSYDSIGGLDKQLKLIRETIEFGASNSQRAADLPRGILLFGAPGTGKSEILKAIYNNINLDCIFVNGTELISRGTSEAENKLRLVFKKATERNLGLVILDEIEMLCSKRKTSENERRIVAILLHSISALPKGVMILAATNKLDELEPSLRKPGRFDLEVEIPVPTIDGKLDILTRLLKKVKHCLSIDDIVGVSERAHGYTGADLLALVRQAGLLAAQERTTKDIIISAKNIKESLKNIKPSAMKEVTLEIPKIYWSDIGGMEMVKKKLKQAVEWPLKHPEAFRRLGIAAPHGVLLYGPPGCSKTMIARALATESGLNFIAIKGPELFSKWVGESEQAIRELFRKARAASPCVLFFDEIDALAAERGSSSGGSNVGNRVLAQLLTELDGIEQLNFVTTVAATNRPDLIDNALLRPGRLDSILYVPLPDAQTRKEIFLLKKRNMPFGNDVDVNYLVEKTKGFSGAEIMAVCQEAGLKALDESFDVQTITLSNFDYALQQIQPRTTRDMIDFYENYSVQKIP